MFCTGFSSSEEELSEEDSEAEELSEDESEELSEETELSEELLVSVFEEDEEELLSEELSLSEDSVTDELSLLLGAISIVPELLSEERFPRTASFSIISGSSLTEQPATPMIISNESRMQNIFFIIFPLSGFVYYKEYFLI